MLAFLFPGQGSQAPGMAADLVDLPEARAILDEADAVLHALFDPPPPEKQSALIDADDWSAEGGLPGGVILTDWT